MKDYSQNSNFEVKGRWWLPESNQKFAGELRSKNGTAVLFLYGGFTVAIAKSPLQYSVPQQEFPVLHGESLEGKEITILNSFYSYTSPGIRSLNIQPESDVELNYSRLTCNAIAIGGHVSSIEDKFARCRIEIPSLESWLADAVFTTDNDRSFKSIKVEYHRPPTREYSISGLDCVIRISHSVRPPGYPTLAPRIQHKSYIEIEPNTQQSLDWFNTVSSHVVDLFSLLYGGTLQSKRLKLFGPKAGHELVSVYFPRKKTKKVKYRHFDFFLPSNAVLPDFGTILEKWLSESSLTIQARKIVLSSERYPANFMELRFLPLVHAAEIISKEASSEIVPRPTYSAIRNGMVATIPEGQPKELIESIQNALSWKRPQLKREH